MATSQTPPSSDPSDPDQHWMQRALTLAEGARGLVWPNPPVGCVVVKHGTVLAEAATHPGGRPHAERKALETAGTSAKGATLYVTLEPCCHWGKTPPCTDIIIETGVARVVCCLQDPDPRVNGGGFAALKQAGIAVSLGLCADQAKRIMSGFLHRVRTGLPELVALSKAVTEIPTGLDALLTSTDQGARLAMRSGKIDLPPQPMPQLLRRMGDIGLTSVAIPKSDPLWRQMPALRETRKRVSKPSTPNPFVPLSPPLLGQSPGQQAQTLFHIQRIKGLVREQLGAGPKGLVSLRETLCTDPACPGIATEIRIISPGFEERRGLVHKPLSEVEPSDIALVI
ncbi:bifunctional diaminohydroxyphosphoribosylaminopyrimidine deaminase/5-amino-6-(5-phosphoribosylamino)uracil reductase RibD [Pacificoceanicola onchidii]|uniref:bifunctional diaminohydroxyphosphoribosylaminopyrimidine deaminase/5-amino-6-(5-phosphoribosylamino)uracil reductase RibD n=1 Tax=Pacificoceanicola onchidii TaxID=2562685 RepID=UPI0010A3F1E6|nr:bifunctional diaminohydroxyphosphoribosylaminopyrimidine deaminase/5-amino-6-(5-phosphoribosylamino)uracil reductase RibD [Pacificoceanicola onchidii]